MCSKNGGRNICREQLNIPVAAFVSNFNYKSIISE